MKNKYWSYSKGSQSDGICQKLFEVGGPRSDATDVDPALAGGASGLRSDFRIELVRDRHVLAVTCLLNKKIKKIKSYLLEKYWKIYIKTQFIEKDKIN